MNQEKKPEETPRGRLTFLSRSGFWVRALTVLTIVFAVNLVIEFGVLTSVVPLLHKLQLGSHRILCRMLPRPASPKWVRMVVIDDELHQQLKEPTDRKYLAVLVRNAAKGDATVVVLDFQLTVPRGHLEGDDSPERKEMDGDLRNAIFDAAKLGVPVVVPCCSIEVEAGTMSSLASIRTRRFRCPLKRTARTNAHILRARDAET